MDDRTAAFTGGVEQPGDVGHGLVHARQLQGPTEVLLLCIDDDQAGVAQLGRRVVAASEAEHRGWNGHQGLLGRAFVYLLSPALTPMGMVDNASGVVTGLWLATGHGKRTNVRVGLLDFWPV